jgi:hypothetical protein
MSHRAALARGGRAGDGAPRRPAPCVVGPVEDFAHRRKGYDARTGPPVRGHGPGGRCT